MTHPARAVGGPILTRPFKVLLGLGALGSALIAWRFAVGLGPSTALSDGYPWGLWIAFDVVTGTALACGGYAVAILIYVLNKGRYHPLVRPAILTSALGYSVAAIGIIIDVGRPWIIWRVPIGGFPDVGIYNWSSALLEVALCVMAYIMVLWIELSPALLEKWQADGSRPRLARFSARTYRWLEVLLPWTAAAGILLPTMHQSSLGSLMLLAGPRLHPLWNTAWLPFLFLVGCITMGAAAVVIESTLASTFFGRKLETRILNRLFGTAVITIWIFLGVRFVDLISRGLMPEMFTDGVHSFMFWVETALLVGPLFLYYSSDRQLAPGQMFRGAMSLALAGAVYRFDTYLVAFQPGEHWSYFPNVPEILVTVGIVALEIALYIALVKRFPILSGRRAAVPTG